MKKSLIPAIAAIGGAAAIAISMATSASASTTDVLTYGSAGSNVSSGAALSSSLAAGTDATFYTTTTGTTGQSCGTGTTSTQVTANPAAGGTATLSAESVRFTSCSNTYNDLITTATFDVNTISIGTSGSSTSDATASVTYSIPRDLNGAQTCDYAGSVSGTNSFSNQEFTLTGGYIAGSLAENDSACATTLYFTAAFGATEDTSVSGDPDVAVNT
jgi:hypothetical protein